MYKNVQFLKISKKRKKERKKEKTLKEIIKIIKKQKGWNEFQLDTKQQYITVHSE